MTPLRETISDGILTHNHHPFKCCNVWKKKCKLTGFVINHKNRYDTCCWNPVLKKSTTIGIVSIISAQNMVTLYDVTWSQGIIIYDPSQAYPKYFGPFEEGLITTFIVETHISQDSFFKTMAAYALVPCVARPSTTMAMTIQNRRVLISHEEEFHLPVLPHCLQTLITRSWGQHGAHLGPTILAPWTLLSENAKYISKA